MHVTCRTGPSAADPPIVARARRCKRKQFGGSELVVVGGLISLIIVLALSAFGVDLGPWYIGLPVCFGIYFGVCFALLGVCIIAGTLIEKRSKETSSSEPAQKPPTE
jgi:hypothetical protein